MELKMMLRKTMKDRSLTFKKLADMTGVPLSVLKDWANGISPRDLDAVRKVAQALGVPFERLIFGAEDHSNQSIEAVLNAIPTRVLHKGWVKVTIELPDDTIEKKEK